MKKIVLSVLCGFMIIGSAFALPSPEDRKALCEKQPDKFVWVEKNKTCIPVDPCSSSDSTIYETYCLLFPMVMPANKGDFIINTFVEKRLNTNVVSIEKGRKNDFEDSQYFIVKTADSGFYEVNMGLSASEDPQEKDLYLLAAMIYADKDLKSLHDIQKAGHKYLYYNGISQQMCRDMSDFASQVVGYDVSFVYLDSDEEDEKTCMYMLK